MLSSLFRQYVTTKRPLSFVGQNTNYGKFNNTKPHNLTYRFTEKKRAQELNIKLAMTPSGIELAILCTARKLGCYDSTDRANRKAATLCSDTISPTVRLGHSPQGRAQSRIPGHPGVFLTRCLISQHPAAS